MKTDRILNLIVVLTLLTGQVEYAVSSYFCMMEKRVVSSTRMDASSSCISSSDECCMDRTPSDQESAREHLSGADCCQVQVNSKMVTDSFIATNDLTSHIFSSHLVATVPTVQPGTQLGGTTFLGVIPVDSSPPAPPLTQAVLRI